jgi:hypothetical protein
MPTLFIDTDGQMSGLESPVTQLLRLGDRRRVSHVEPVNPWLRAWFHWLRQRTTDESRLAGFTRRWPCRWQARVFDGPVLGPFRLRSEAIAAEIQFINSRLEGTL